MRPALATDRGQCIIGCHEVCQVGAQLVVVIVVETLDRRVFDRAVHALHLTIGPRVIGFGKAMLDTIGLTDHVETHWP